MTKYVNKNCEIRSEENTHMDEIQANVTFRDVMLFLCLLIQSTYMAAKPIWTHDGSNNENSLIVVSIQLWFRGRDSTKNPHFWPRWLLNVFTACLADDCLSRNYSSIKTDSLVRIVASHLIVLHFSSSAINWCLRKWSVYCLKHWAIAYIVIYIYNYVYNL